MLPGPAGCEDGGDGGGQQLLAGFSIPYSDSLPGVQHAVLGSRLVLFASTL